MQVDYDSTYLHEEEDAQKKLRVRNKMITGHKMAIVEVEMSDPNDFEALTTLYRKIFRFLLEFAPNSKTDKVLYTGCRCSGSYIYIFVSQIKCP